MYKFSLSFDNFFLVVMDESELRSLNDMEEYYKG